MSMVLFGPSGNSESFYERFKGGTEDSARDVREHGLDLFEYSFGRGVKMGEAKAASIREAFARERVEISVHAPYYINFANPDEENVQKSVAYVLESLEKVLAMGGDRVVFHPGSVQKRERQEASALLFRNMEKLLKALDGFPKEIKICPETMGKIGQLGTPEEIVGLCNLDERLYPCFDFGHINAREQGILRTREDYERLYDFLQSKLPERKVNEMHIHFSKIQYGSSGEIRHLTFEDEVFGPPFEPLLEVLAERRLSCHVLCESAGTQIEDAAAMKRYYDGLLAGSEISR